MKQVTDYYAVLGVDANAPPETIKKTFKHLALQYHPDIYKGEDAEERMREILLAYQTLFDPESRRSYDISRLDHIPGSSMAQAKNTEVSPTARRDRQRYYGFPTLNEDAPAQIDLGEITYLLSPGEVRRLKVQGILRGAKAPSMAGTYYCHRCQHQWQAASLRVFCPNCQARDWREYLLLRCQHCHAVFERCCWRTLQTAIQESEASGRIRKKPTKSEHSLPDEEEHDVSQTTRSWPYS